MSELFAKRYKNFVFIISDYFDKRLNCWQITLIPNICFFTSYDIFNGKKENRCFSISVILFVFEIQFWFGNVEGLAD